MAAIKQAIQLIDDQNAQDPNKEQIEGKEYPKELLYAQRMSQKLMEFKPNASEALQIAVRGQHICRWKVPRNSYPMDRKGYLKWRENLKEVHAQLTSKILREVGYEASFVDRVSFLIQKKHLKKDEETQTLEDVVCLVFLQYYFEGFAQKHPDEKVVAILQKTWRKMSATAQKAALSLPFSTKSLDLIHQVIV